MALAYKFTAGTGTPAATLVAGGSASILYGLSATNGEAAAIFLKLYWEGTGVAPPTIPGGAQPAVTVPIAGTTIPSLTIAVPVGGIYNLGFIPVNNGGRMWYWVTKNAADSDATALTTGGDVFTIIYG